MQLVPIGIPTLCLYNLVLNLIKISSKIKVRVSHTFWQDHNLYLLCSLDVKKALLHASYLQNKEILPIEKFFQLYQIVFFH